MGVALRQYGYDGFHHVFAGSSCVHIYINDCSGVLCPSSHQCLLSRCCTCLLWSCNLQVLFTGGSSIQLWHMRYLPHHYWRPVGQM